MKSPPRRITAAICWLSAKTGVRIRPRYVDFTNLVLGEPFDIPDGTPFMLNGYDTGIFNSSGIYGLFLDETGVAAENFICDFLASDIASQVNAVVSLSENCFYAIMIDLVDHERRLCRLDMLSRDEVSAQKDADIVHAVRPVHTDDSLRDIRIQSNEQRMAYRGQLIYK